MEQFKGLRLEILGVTYSFVGILRDINQNHIVVEDVVAVEKTPTDIRPNGGIHTKSKIIMNTEAIAGFYQPKYLTSWED